MSTKVWFITGASRGFGRVWTEAALERGDRVVATARDLSTLIPLVERFGDAVLPLELDVTQTSQVREAVARAHERFGVLDVVLNNAGYSLVGTTEEASEDDVRAVFDTNYLGTLRVIQAALPLLREQGHGHVVGVSSGLAIAAMPLIGFYCATKWAFEALHDALAEEVAPFGIDVTLIEPGAYATEFGSAASLKHAATMSEYDGLREKIFGGLATMERGDPTATASAVLALVDADHPPRRFALGSYVLERARTTYAQRIAEWEAWESVSSAAF